MNIGEGISGASFSDSNWRYRYALWRIWDLKGDKLLFIGLNPSTANSTKDDPTITRLVGFAKHWGFGGLYAGNLFSHVTPDPDHLIAVIDTPDKVNDSAIKMMRQLSSKVLAGWGNCLKHMGGRPNQVLALLGEPVFCLRVTKAGEPSHPLYLPWESQLIEYKREK